MPKQEQVTTTLDKYTESLKAVRGYGPQHFAERILGANPLAIAGGAIVETAKMAVRRGAGVAIGGICFYGLTKIVNSQVDYEMPELLGGGVVDPIQLTAIGIWASEAIKGVIESGAIVHASVKQYFMVQKIKSMLKDQGEQSIEELRSQVFAATRPEVNQVYSSLSDIDSIFHPENKTENKGKSIFFAGLDITLAQRIHQEVNTNLIIEYLDREFGKDGFNKYSVPEKKAQLEEYSKLTHIVLSHFNVTPDEFSDLTNRLSGVMWERPYNKEE